MSTQQITIGGINHSKVTTEMADGRTVVLYYVFRTNKAGKVVRALLNEATHRHIIRQIETRLAGL